VERILSIPDNKNYLCTLSGGLDSSMLTFLVLQFLPNSGVILSSGCHKHLDYYNETNVKQIHDWLNARFPNRILYHHIEYYEDRKDAQSRRSDITSKLIREWNIEGIFSGMTANPDVATLMTEDRDKRRDDPTNWDTINKSGIHHYQPFIDKDKKYIAKLYNELKIKDLISLTVSCESETPPRPCCGCWWCREKFWAFGYY
jgi:hypothetical protein